MGTYTRRIALVTTNGASFANFGNTVDSFQNEKIVSITTRTDGKSFGGATVVSEAVLKTIELKLKVLDGIEKHVISLARVLDLSKMGYGFGLPVDEKIDFYSSQLICNDPAALVNGQAVELTFTFEKG